MRMTLGELIAQSGRRVLTGERMLRSHHSTELEHLLRRESTHLLRLAVKFWWRQRTRRKGGAV
jgi:hypothetical protein